MFGNRVNSFFEVLFFFLKLHVITSCNLVIYFVELCGIAMTQNTQSKTQKAQSKSQKTLL